MTAPAPRRAPAERRAQWDRVSAWALANIPALVRDYTGRELRRAGPNYRGPCPMHGGDHPEAFSVRPGKPWRCWTGECGAGDGVELVRRLRFPALDKRAGRLAALRELAPLAGVHLDDAPGDAGAHPGSYRIGGPAPAPPLSPAAEAPPAPPAKPSPAARIAAALEALRAAGVVPSPPPVLYRAALAALTLTDAGAAYLAGRGFDPAACARYGLRSVDGAAGWGAWRDALAADFDPAERDAAGLGANALPPRDWPAGVPALVLPYFDRGEPIGLRLRRLDGGERHKYHTFGGGNPAAPFNASALDGCAGAVVYVVEGELNALALAVHGRRAIGVPGATTWGTYAAATLPRLRDVRRCIAWWDADTSGRQGLGAFARTATAQLGARWLAARGLCVTVEPDANAQHVAGTLAATLAAIESLPPTAPR